MDMMGVALGCCYGTDVGVFEGWGIYFFQGASHLFP